MRSRVRRACVGVLTTLLVIGLAPLTLPAAAAEAPGISVRITGLSPSRLAPDSTVVMSGTVTNRGDATWTDAQAYLVIPRTPFTTRQQVQDAISDGSTYTGERVVDLDSIDELGSLTPDDTVDFRVRVPASSLAISGAQGVYPVGIQILATAEDGTRENAAIARATTFVPLVGDGLEEPTPAGVVWPFVMPAHRDADGRYVDPEALLRRISAGGQLRNLLDHALASPPEATTVLLDPALLVGVADLAEGRRLPEGLTLDDGQRAAAERFRTDLVDLARRTTSWVLGQGRPDLVAIARSSESRELLAAVDRATTATLAEFGLTGRRASWPAAGDTTQALVHQLRRSGESPIIVDRATLPEWEPRQGSIVSRPTSSGPVPLLVDAGLDADVPGVPTVTTLRQRLLSEAALGSLERSSDGGSRADAIGLVDPGWDPGPVSAGGGLGSAFEAPFVRPVTLDDLMTERLATVEGDLRETASTEPIGAAHVASVEEAARLRSVLASLAPDSAGVENAAARTLAEALGLQWRSHREQGLAVARAAVDAAQRDLDAISVEGPPAVTLSSAEGTFPLTISNGASHPIRVGVRISSSNPTLAVDDLEPIEVAADERRTVTVTADVGTSGSSTFTAQLVTPEGMEVGEPAAFNVRSSNVGAAVWVAMALAALLVAVALSRRFIRSRGRTGEPAAADE